MESANFEIKTTPGNRDNSLPEHHDIYLKGSEDSLITVWAERKLAEMVIETLDTWSRARAFKA